MSERPSEYIEINTPTPFYDGNGIDLHKATDLKFTLDEVRDARAVAEQLFRPSPKKYESLPTFKKTSVDGQRVMTMRKDMELGTETAIPLATEPIQADLNSAAKQYEYI